MITPAAFQKFMTQGMAASPFTGSLTVLMDGKRIEVSCLVDEGTNKVEVEELGAEAEYVIKAHILKSMLPRQPDIALDAVIYKGRSYKLRPMAGDVDASPVWAVEGRSPTKK